MATFVVLLRAVNVGGRKVTLDDLRLVCGKLGYTDVRTYIQSGNLVIKANTTAARLQADIQGGLRAALRMDVPTIVRTAAQWAAYPKGNPFPDGESKMVHLILSQNPPAPGCVAVLNERAERERIHLAGDALWIDYVDGAGRSKLTPQVIDRAMGSSATARNMNTVTALAQMAAQ